MSYKQELIRMEDKNFYRRWWQGRTAPDAGGDDPSHKEERAHGHQLDRIWEASEAYGRQEPPDVEGAWQRLAGQLDRRPSRRLSVYRRGWAVAATVVLLLAVGLYWYTDRQPQSAADYATFLTTTTMQTVTLPDGTRVVMNRNSRLQYAKDFQHPPDSRQVAFSGEAYFEVVPDAVRPFVISTNMAHIEVKGTAFNLRAFPQDSMLEVDVKTGRVALRSMLDPAVKPIEVQANYCGIVSRASGRAELRRADTPNRHAWRTQTLVFSNTKLSEALQWVERAYNIKFSYPADQFTDCPITTTLEDAELDQVLARLARLTGAEFGVRTDSTIPLISGCETRNN